VTEPQSGAADSSVSAERISEKVASRILIVDDEPMIASLLRRLIGKEHEVVIVLSGSEAKSRLQAGERFDAIMCDLMMPGMGGVDLHAELMQFVPDQAGRMIFMTGGAFTDATRSFLDRVPNPRVDKPFDVAVVRETLRTVLARATK
jgi:CheY-like chemotaxis protein